METLDPTVLTNSEELEAYRLSTLARLHARFEERVAFARKAIADLEELHQLAGVANDTEVEAEVARRLDQARDELSRLQTLVRETNGGTPAEALPATNGKASKEASPEGWWKNGTAKEEPAVPVEECPAEKAANGEGALTSSWGGLEVTPATRPKFEQRAREETSAFDFTALLGGMQGQADPPPAPAEELFPALAANPAAALEEAQGVERQAAEVEAPPVLIETPAVIEEPGVIEALQVAGEPPVGVIEAPAAPAQALLPPFDAPVVARAATILEVSVTVGYRTRVHRIAGEMLVGRRDPEQRVHPDLDLFPDAAVSRRHGQVFQRGGDYYYRDLDSLNGTQHNGRAVPPRVDILLAAGDELVLGEQTRIVLVEAGV